MTFISEIFGYPLGWIMWACFQVLKNYGVSLIVFTLIVKLLLVPLSIKQQKATIKMQLLKPKQEEIQKKYAKDQQKQQQAMMELYKQEGYSPLSGCLPLLIQFPILFGLINVIYNPLTHILRIAKNVIGEAGDILNTLGISANGYMQQNGIISAIQDPATTGSFSSLGEDIVRKIQNFDMNFLGMNLGAIPGYTFPLIIIPILSGLTSLGATLYTQKFSSAGDGQQAGGGMMKGMIYLMPVLSFFFAVKLPLGVGLYWIFSNVFSFVQTVIINKKYNVKKIVEEIKQKEEEEKKNRKDLKAEVTKKLAEGEVVAKEDREKVMTAKEINRAKLAEARKRDAEKYGEEYVEVTDEDLM